ncbi:MAG TPA: preprotein translocase subunit YajC [Patescibacteria group bacterium]|nr:preprotein translocase subunit YajC [Patescibacteria group bacterium]
MNLNISPEILQAIQASWPIVLMGVIFYFLLYRPQKKEQQKRASLLNSLKKGDKVVTIGGLHGVIVSINEKTAVLQVAEKVELVFSRSAISGFQNAAKTEEK